MRTTLRFFLLLAATALLASACSSSSTVVRDERATSSDSASDESSSSSDPVAPDAGADNVQDETQESAEAVDEAMDDEEAVLDDAEPESALDFADDFDFGLGDPEQVVPLTNDCVAGNNMACDILYMVSNFDSEEESLALVCGGRSADEVVFCTEGINSVADEFSFESDSPAIPAIQSACEEDGDMLACDFLYYRSPIGSALEDVGATCGDRVTVAIPDCRTFFNEG